MLGCAHIVVVVNCTRRLSERWSILFFFCIENSIKISFHKLFQNTTLSSYCDQWSKMPFVAFCCKTIEPQQRVYVDELKKKKRTIEIFAIKIGQARAYVFFFLFNRKKKVTKDCDNHASKIKISSTCLGLLKSNDLYMEDEECTGVIKKFYSKQY